MALKLCIISSNTASAPSTKNAQPLKPIAAIKVSKPLRSPDIKAISVRTIANTDRIKVVQKNKEKVLLNRFAAPAECCAGIRKG